MQHLQPRDVYLVSFSVCRLMAMYKPDETKDRSFTNPRSVALNRRLRQKFQVTLYSDSPESRGFAELPGRVKMVGQHLRYRIRRLRGAPHLNSNTAFDTPQNRPRRSRSRNYTRNYSSARPLPPLHILSMRYNPEKPTCPNPEGETGASCTVCFPGTAKDTSKYARARTENSRRPQNRTFRTTRNAGCRCCAAPAL